MPIVHPFSFLQGHAPGPINPGDLANLILWLKADALSLSDNDPVSTWTDSSGALNNATSAGTNRPLFKTAIRNGLPVVRFDGTNDYMVVPGFAKAEFTAFYVYIASAGGIVAEHSVNGGTNNGDYHYRPGGAHVAAKGTGGFSAYDITAPSLATGTWRYISRAMNGTNASHHIWVNGVLGTRGATFGTGNPGAGVVTADYYIGGRAGTSLFTTGDIAEIIIYKYVLSTGDRQSIESYLAAKYAL